MSRKLIHRYFYTSIWLYSWVQKMILMDKFDFSFSARQILVWIFRLIYMCVSSSLHRLSVNKEQIKYFKSYTFPSSNTARYTRPIDPSPTRFSILKLPVAICRSAIEYDFTFSGTGVGILITTGLFEMSSSSNDLLRSTGGGLSVTDVAVSRVVVVIEDEECTDFNSANSGLPNEFQHWKQFRRVRKWRRTRWVQCSIRRQSLSNRIALDMHVCDQWQLTSRPLITNFL